MTKQLATFAFICAVVLVPAGAGAAGGAAKPPTALILQKSDFPAGTTYDADDSDLSGFKPRLQAAGIEYEAATATGLHHTSAKGSLNVTATVFAVPSVPMAKKAFKLLKVGREPFWSAGGAPFSVRPYADEQFGRLKPAGSEGIWFARMVFRKRATVWTLHVTSERRPPIAKSDVLAAFNAFARKQQSRVGAG
jgi:hypothetical protein